MTGAESNILLSHNVDDAKRQFEEDMALLLQRASNLDFPDFCENVPIWNPAAWADDGIHHCYNFGLNRRNGRHEEPGDISKSKPRPLRGAPFEEYASGVFQSAVGDGLKPLGGNFLNCGSDGTPVALFARPSFFSWLADYHWIALRRQPDTELSQKFVWAHKLGPADAELVKDLGDMKAADIFDTALDGPYGYFLGFLSAPNTLQEP